MSPSDIDLCEDLRLADFLDDLEETLADRALKVVSLCKGTWQEGKWELLEEQLAPPDMDIRPTDYFLVCGSAPREDCDGFMGLFQHRENNTMVLGAFQRDSHGRVYEKAFQPARFVGEPEANFVPLGSVDFILRPA